MFSTDDSKAFYFGETDFGYFTWLPEIIKAMPEYAPCGEYTVWEPVSPWYGTKSAALEYFNATRDHVCDPKGMAMMQSQRDSAHSSSSGSIGRSASSLARTSMTSSVQHQTRHDCLRNGLYPK
jgi:hypothetical protein